MIHNDRFWWREADNLLLSSGCIFIRSSAVLFVVIEYLQEILEKASLLSLWCYVLLCHLLPEFSCENLAQRWEFAFFRLFRLQMSRLWAIGFCLQAEELADNFLSTTRNSTRWQTMRPETLDRWDWQQFISCCVLVARCATQELQLWAEWIKKDCGRQALYYPRVRHPLVPWENWFHWITLRFGRQAESTGLRTG